MHLYRVIWYYRAGNAGALSFARVGTSDVIVTVTKKCLWLFVQDVREGKPEMSTENPTRSSLLSTGPRRGSVRVQDLFLVFGRATLFVSHGFGVALTPDKVL